MGGGRGVALIFGLLAGGCLVSEKRFPDEFAEKYCAARWACGCNGPDITEVACLESLPDDMEEIRAEAQDLDLEFDRECAQQLLDAIDDSCEPAVSRFGWPPCDEFCPIYRGDRQEDQACESLPSSAALSNCGRGLECVGGKCRGEFCFDEGESCSGGDISFPCRGGLTCSLGVCVVVPGKGESCTGECAQDYACDADDVCVDAPSIGESCIEHQCAAHAQCTGGSDLVCEEAPATICQIDLPW